ncbi:MAG: tandem-95 repeat protein, partial [Opitutae bacterium]|nr:tandem-95 repeat protein [Opitutae bacterium]
MGSPPPSTFVFKDWREPSFGVFFWLCYFFPLAQLLQAAPVNTLPALISVTDVNDAPVNFVPTDQNLVEDTQLNFSSGNSNVISVSDQDENPESGNLKVFLQVDKGLLDLSGLNGLTLTIWDGTKDANLIFSGTPNAINLALEGMTYQSPAGFIGESTLTITTLDNGDAGTGTNSLTASDTVTLSVNPANNPPLIVAPDIQTIDEDTILTFATVTGNGLSFSDPEEDATVGTLSVSLDAPHGVLSLSTVDGLTITAGDGTEDESLAFSGSPSNINSALDGLVYQSNLNFNGASTLILSVTDTGDIGTNLNPITQTKTVNVIVIPVNDTPVNIIPTDQLLVEDTSLTFSMANTNSLTVSDPDEDAFLGNLTVSLQSTNSVVSLSGVNGLTFTIGNGDEDSILLFSGSPSNINSALEGLIYKPNLHFDGESTLTLATIDSGDIGTGLNSLTQADAIRIILSAVNDFPINVIPSDQTTVEDTPLVFAIGNANGLSVSDRDEDLSIGNLMVSLQVTNGVLSLSQVTGLTFTSGDGTGDSILLFSGSPNNINAALEGLVYQPSPGFNGLSTLTIATTDNIITDTDTVTTVVSAVNDAPTITFPDNQTLTEDVPLTFSIANGNVLSVADDAAEIGGSIEVEMSVGNGTLELSEEIGLTFSAGSNGSAAMTFTGEVLSVTTALDGLSYQPDLHFNGPDQLEIRVNDQGSVGNGNVEESTATVDLTVTAVNDSPVNVIPPDQTTVEDTALIFATGNTNGLSVADPEEDGATGTLTVTLEVTNGDLTLSGVTGLTMMTGDGVSDASLVFSGSPNNVNAALEGLLYQPIVNFNGVSALTFSTADSENTSTGSVGITVSAVNDAPIVTVPAGQILTEDSSLKFNIANGNVLSVADDATEVGGSIAVELSVGNGTLELGQVTGLTFSEGSNGSATMIFTGEVSSITTALDGLSYLPDLHFNGTDQLEVRVNDQGSVGSGNIEERVAMIDLTVIAVNDTPVNDVPDDPVLVEDIPLTFSTGNSNALSVFDPDEDVDNGNLTVSLEVTNGALTLSGVTGLTLTIGDGVGDASLVFSGSPNSINAALDGLVYQSPAGFNGVSKLTLVSLDSEHSDTDNVVITVSAVNDAPIVTVPLTQILTEDSSLKFSIANGNVISVADDATEVGGS